MKNVVAKNSSKITAIERFEVKKLNMSTLGEIVGERYRYDGFS